MKRREQFLGVGVALALVIGLTVRFLPEDFSLAGGELESARRTFSEYRDTLLDGPDIQAAYRKVEAQFPERSGTRTPESTFSDEVDKLLKDNGIAQPFLKPPERSSIPDVEEYYYIDLQVTRIPGTVQSLTMLLMEFDRKGLLVKAFDLSKTDFDGDDAKMDVTVSRLAKMDEDELRRNRQRRERGRR